MASKFFPMESQSDLRVVLVGQERVGKSSAGNTILGRKEFDCRFSSTPLTLCSQKAEGDVQGLSVSVVDTPGLSNTRLSAEEVKAELLRAVQLSSPGPHVFLLTLQLGRFTPQEQEGLQTLKKMLSPEVCERTMLLFTYGDRLEDMDMDQFIREDDNLQELLRQCSGKYHVLNNKKMDDREQVQELLDKIQDASQGGQVYYKYEKSVWKRFMRSVWFSLWARRHKICLVLCCLGIMYLSIHSSIFFHLSGARSRGQQCLPFPPTPPPAPRQGPRGRPRTYVSQLAWVCPGASCRWDMPGTPPQGGVQEASRTDARATSADSSRYGGDQNQNQNQKYFPDTAKITQPSSAPQSDHSHHNSTLDQDITCPKFPDGDQ